MEIETIEKIATKPLLPARHHLPQLPIAYALELKRMIETEAFLIAEKDGFKRAPEEYWLQAECHLHHYF